MRQNTDIGPAPGDSIHDSIRIIHKGVIRHRAKTESCRHLNPVTRHRDGELFLVIKAEGNDLPPDRFHQQRIEAGHRNKAADQISLTPGPENTAVLFAVGNLGGEGIAPLKQGQQILIGLIYGLPQLFEGEVFPLCIIHDCIHSCCAAV